MPFPRYNIYSPDDNCGLFPYGKTAEFHGPKQFNAKTVVTEAIADGTVSKPGTYAVAYTYSDRSASVFFVEVGPPVPLPQPPLVVR